MKQKKEARTTHQQMLIVLLAFGAVLAIASLLLRALTNGEYEVKTVDLIFLVIPLLVVALVTGNLESIDLLGLKANFSKTWAEAVRKKIRDQVSDLTPSTLEDAMEVQDIAKKSSLSELHQSIERRFGFGALEFGLGSGTYRNDIIKKYFDILSGSLRVVVVNDPEGKLFAIYDAPNLISSLRLTGPNSYAQLGHLLNSGDEEARAGLTKLPGFVGADNSVTEDTSKRDALAMMETLNTDILPVVNEEERFIGTIGRSKLTAGLILAVTDKLEDR